MQILLYTLGFEAQPVKSFLYQLVKFFKSATTRIKKGRGYVSVLQLRRQAENILTSIVWRVSRDIGDPHGIVRDTERSTTALDEAQWKAGVPVEA